MSVYSFSGFFQGEGDRWAYQEIGFTLGELSLRNGANTQDKLIAESSGQMTQSVQQKEIK